MPNICYFEIPVEDTQRAQHFYQNLFNWRFEKSDTAPEHCDYWAIETGNPNEPGLNLGGLLKKQDPKHQVTQYVNVDSVEVYLEKAQRLGAIPIVPKTAVPGKGYFAICLDLDKNPIGLWQCDADAG